MQLVGVSVLPVEVLAHGFGGKLRLAEVTEIPGKVHRLTWGGICEVIVGVNCI